MPTADYPYESTRTRVPVREYPYESTRTRVPVREHPYVSTPTRVPLRVPPKYCLRLSGLEQERDFPFEYPGVPPQTYGAEIGTRPADVGPRRNDIAVTTVLNCSRSRCRRLTVGRTRQIMYPTVPREYPLSTLGGTPSTRMSTRPVLQTWAGGRRGCGPSRRRRCRECSRRS